jgi:hypothetical protein
MDIVNKAIAKASDLASEAAWNAQQRIKISTEEKRIEDLRNKILAKRAEIGDEMFRLWQAHKLPPSQLDGLFYELQDLVDANAGAAQNLDALKAETYEQATSAQAQTATSYAAAIPSLPAAPLPPGSAPPALEPGRPAPAVLDVTPAMTLVECANCHSMVRADRNFCGRCGHRLR